MEAHRLSQRRPVPSDERLLFRFALGAAFLARDRLVAELRARAMSHEPAPVVEPAGFRHRLIGGGMVATTAIRAAARSVRDTGERVVERLSSPAARVLRATRSGRRLETRARWLRHRLADELTSWGKRGQAEEAAGRALAEASILRMYREVLDWLSASPEVQHLIEENTAGLTRGMVDELRELSASADTRAERLVRRWTKRG